ncbi:MAG TPA: hypothetical protein VFP86_14405 [bacterium]|nr:hypothetical protein [bacterium]
MGSSHEDLSPPWVPATQFGAVIFDLFGTLVPNFSKLELERVLCEMATLLGAPPQHVVRLWLDTFPQRAVGTFPTIEVNIGTFTARSM